MSDNAWLFIAFIVIGLGLMYVDYRATSGNCRKGKAARKRKSLNDNI